MKKLFTVLLAAMMTLSLAACSGGSSAASKSSASQGSSEKKDAEHFIGFSAMTFTDNWMVQTDEAIAKICEERGYNYTKSSAEGVAATQVSQIENMITMGCDVILITPMDLDALHDVMKKAHDEGVTCVYVGDPYEGEEPFAICLNVDQRDFGSKAAKAAADWIEATYPDAEDGSIEVAVFQNTSGEPFVLRADGMHDIEKFTSKAKVVETYDLVGQNNMNSMCQEYTDQLLVKHPNVKVIVSHSADFANAIDEVIMRTPEIDPATMGIFACDWLLAGAQAVRSSKNNESTFRAFIDSGEFALPFVQAGVGELEVNEKGQAVMELYTFTADNVDEAYKMHNAE